MKFYKIQLVLLLFLTGIMAKGQSTNCQALNQIIVDSKISAEVCIGYWNADSLAQSRLFKSYFDVESKNLNWDKKQLKKLSKLLKNKKIVIVFGSWCSDSQREIPRMIGLLKAAKFNFKNLTLVGVDRNKTALDIDLSLYKIQFVPTLILFENATEMGRIVEEPKVSLIEDLMQMVEGRK